MFPRPPSPFWAFAGLVDYWGGAWQWMTLSWTLPSPFPAVLSLGLPSSFGAPDGRRKWGSGLDGLVILGPATLGGSTLTVLLVDYIPGTDGPHCCISLLGAGSLYEELWGPGGGGGGKIWSLRCR